MPIVWKEKKPYKRRLKNGKVITVPGHRQRYKVRKQATKQKKTLARAKPKALKTTTQSRPEPTKPLPPVKVPKTADHHLVDEMEELLDDL